MFGILEYPPFGYGYRYEPYFARRLYRSSMQRELEKILYDGLFDLCDDLAGGEELETVPETKEAPQQEERQFSFSSFRQSRRGGAAGELVEEHRERVVRGDGSVHTVTRRQLGDRWYVHESHSTKDGESSSKETWHNVPEDAIESFKSEWEEKRLITDQRNRPLQQPEPEPESETEKPALQDNEPESQSQ